MNIKTNNNKKTYDLSDFSDYCSNFHVPKDGLYYFLKDVEDFKLEEVTDWFNQKFLRLKSRNYEICDDILIEDLTDKEIEIIYYVYNNK